MSEKLEKHRPKLTLERFEDLSPTEQKVLIYFTTAPVDSDISIEELGAIKEIADDEEDLRSALTSLGNEGILEKGMNPRREREFEVEEERYYIVDPGDYNFLQEELPKIFGE